MFAKTCPSHWGEGLCARQDSWVVSQDPVCFKRLDFILTLTSEVWHIFHCSSIVNQGFLPWCRYIMRMVVWWWVAVPLRPSGQRRKTPVPQFQLENREKRIRQQCHADNSISMNMLDVETTIINNTFSSIPITWVQDNKQFFKAGRTRWKDIQLIVF